MHEKPTIKIIVPASCVSETSTPGDLCWQFGTFLGGLQRHGIAWHEVPDELREIGSLNTSCGGHRSNGSRTSLRNLVVLEGTEFARAFLQAASCGADRLGWKMRANPFLAELEWLDLVGDRAAGMLEDHDKPLHLLDAANSAFFKSLELSDHARKEMLAPVAADLKERFERAERNARGPVDGAYARIYLYVLGHPSLEIVETGTGADGKSFRDRRIEEVAEGMKSGRSSGAGVSLRKDVH